MSRLNHNVRIATFLPMNCVLLVLRSWTRRIAILSAEAAYETSASHAQPSMFARAAQSSRTNGVTFGVPAAKVELDTAWGSIGWPSSLALMRPGQSIDHLI